MDKPWRDDLTRLFLIENGTARLLRRTYVQAVLWPKHGENIAKVVLKGMMPNSKGILNFPEGATLSLTHGYCRDSHAYDQGDEIMRFDNCRVVRKWVIKLGSGTGPSEEIYLRILLDCAIEVTA